MIRDPRPRSRFARKRKKRAGSLQPQVANKLPGAPGPYPGGGPVGVDHRILVRAGPTRTAPPFDVGAHRSGPNFVGVRRGWAPADG